MAKLESDLNSIHGCITEIQQISDAFFENNTSSQQGPNDLGGGGGGSGGDGSKGPLSPSSPMEGLLPAKERRSDGAADFKTLTDNIEGITVIQYRRQMSWMNNLRYCHRNSFPTNKVRQKFWLMAEDWHRFIKRIRNKAKLSILSS